MTEHKIWICPAGQHLCEKYSICRYGPNSSHTPRRERWDCPGPLTTEAEIRQQEHDERHEAGMDGFGLDWAP